MGDFQKTALIAAACQWISACVRKVPYPVSARSMRFLLTWLMVVSALAGLNARSLGTNVILLGDCSHPAEVCYQEDPHAACAPLDSHGGNHDDCPPGDHHHHSCSCSHALPLTVENNLPCRLGDSGSSLLGARHEGEVPPEGPFLGSEKPPLI